MTLIFWASSRDYGTFLLRNLILQTRMSIHPVGLDVWFLVGSFVYFDTLCVRTAKALNLYANDVPNDASNIRRVFFCFHRYKSWKWLNLKAWKHVPKSHIRLWLTNIKMQRSNRFWSLYRGCKEYAKFWLLQLKPRCDCAHWPIVITSHQNKLDIFSLEFMQKWRSGPYANLSFRFNRVYFTK